MKKKEKEIWITHNWFDDIVYFDSEETARLDYEKWCDAINQKYNEEEFSGYYYPLKKEVTILTTEDVEIKWR